METLQSLTGLVLLTGLAWLISERRSAFDRRLIMTYALCGFANFGSLGIMLGGMGAMVPERREEIVALGMKSLLSGTLATCPTGAMVGVVSGF